MSLFQNGHSGHYKGGEDSHRTLATQRPRTCGVARTKIVETRGGRRGDTGKTEKGRSSQQFDDS